MERKISLVKRRLLYTTGILLVYILGQNIPIPWVLAEKDAGAISNASFMNSLLGQSDHANVIFSLGIGPWMTATILYRLLHSLESKDATPKTQEQVKFISGLTALIIAVLQGMLLVKNSTFVNNGMPLWEMQLATVTTVVCGAFVVVWMANRCMDKGLGGTSAIILVNVLGSFRSEVFAQIMNSEPNSGLLYSLETIFLMIVVIMYLLMEDGELRLPINRIDIQNDFKDDNYIALKVNPAGAMGVMFAMGVFAIPTEILALLLRIDPTNTRYMNAIEVLQLNTWSGAAIFLLILIALQFGFGFINCDPAEIADQFMEIGDCIDCVRPGTPTEIYIKRRLLLCCAISSVVVALSVGIPLSIMVVTGMYSSIYRMVISIIIIVGMVSSCVEHANVLRDLESYPKGL